MGDRAYTTVAIWPWPEETGMAQDLREAVSSCYVEECAVVKDGDQETGRILAIVDEEANYGTHAYDELIVAASQAGLNVYAANGGGGDYDAGYRFYPASGEPVQRSVADSTGSTVLDAAELLEECRGDGSRARTLGAVNDAAVGRAAKRLFTEPAVPGAVTDALWR